jgi:hypothetical protein
LRPSLRHESLGERDDPAFTRSKPAAWRAAGECGINFNFAPVLDVNKNPANPIIAGKERSFSADPDALSPGTRPSSSGPITMMRASSARASTFPATAAAQPIRTRGL